jgi:hypothetical protein
LAPFDRFALLSGKVASEDFTLLDAGFAELDSRTAAVEVRRRFIISSFSFQSKILAGDSDRHCSASGHA